MCYPIPSGYVSIREQCSTIGAELYNGCTVVQISTTYACATYAFQDDCWSSSSLTGLIPINISNLLGGFSEPITQPSFIQMESKFVLSRNTLMGTQEWQVQTFERFTSQPSQSKTKTNPHSTN